MTTPRFEANAMATLDRVQKTFTQRGAEYGDTWRNCKFITFKSVAKDLGVEVPDEFCRALVTAGFIDMKYQRPEGGYKDDSIIDGIAYMAYLAQEMLELKAALASKAEYCDRNRITPDTNGKKGPPFMVSGLQIIGDEI